MRKLIFLLVLLAMSILSCKSRQEKAVVFIDKLNAQLTDAPVQDQRVIADSLVTCYLKFVKAYPEHEISPEYLFKAGEVNKGLENYIEAIDNFSQLYTQYPKHDKAGTAMFLQGFIFHDNLGFMDLSKDAFENFLNTYPDHPLVDDAQHYLAIMDMNDDELIDFLKNKEEEE